MTANGAGRISKRTVAGRDYNFTYEAEGQTDDFSFASAEGVLGAEAAQYQYDGHSRA